MGEEGAIFYRDSELGLVDRAANNIYKYVIQYVIQSSYERDNDKGC